MENNTLNAFIAFALMLVLIVAGIRDIKKNGVKIENAAAVLGGIVVMFFGLTAGFWPVTNLGYKFLGQGAQHAEVDDVLSNAADNVLEGDITAVTDNVAASTDGSNKTDGVHSSGPSSDHNQDDGVNVVIIKPTPLPSPTPILYTQKYDKPVVAWGNWFHGNSYDSNGDATVAQIPQGVRCTFKKVDDPWFAPQKWQMTCNDRENSDYGIVTIDLNEAAVKGMGAVDGRTLEGTGDLGPRHYPKGVFETISQSQAPAFAPGPALATSGNGPDVFASQFAGWLVVDSPSGIDCVWDNGSKLLPAGSRHRFDPKSIRNNSPGQIPQVEILMNTEGATCWGVIWRGRSHFE